MKERPILFNGEMVRAILEGRKTQTRRPMKPQPKTDGNWPFAWLSPRSSIFTSHPETIDHSPVFGRAGDRLWVRETFMYHTSLTALCHEKVYAYKADENLPLPLPVKVKWTPSIHMPRWASRITLEVERVWVHRLGEMERADAVAEGFQGTAPRQEFLSFWFEQYEDNFPFSTNPWLWACQFKVISTEAKK